MQIFISRFDELHHDMPGFLFSDNLIMFFEQVKEEHF
jgi:hypothetical protein